MRTEKQINKLITAYDEYIVLLVAEINDLVGLATAHGWKSKRYKMGVKARNKIEKAKLNLTNKGV